MSGERMRFSVAPGVAGILKQAQKDERHEEHTVYLSGDLCQMAAQATFLRNLGIDIQFNNVYPCVRVCDAEEAFQMIWKYKCNGWWHYSNQYVELGICTEDEFKETLSKWCEDHDG